MDTLASCLRGRGYSVIPMIVSLVGSCLLRLVWIATIFRMFRSTGTLYISYPLSWALTAGVHLICLLVVRKRSPVLSRRAFFVYSIFFNRYRSYPPYISRRSAMTKPQARALFRLY